MQKILKSILLFLFNFYKRLWFWFLSLPKAGKILVGSFLVFTFAISSLVNSSNKNIKKSAVLGVQSSQSQSSQFSSSNSNFSIQFSNSSENLAISSEISSQNLAKSTELSGKSPDGVEISSQNTIESAKISQNLEISSQNQPSNSQEPSSLSSQESSQNSSQEAVKAEISQETKEILAVNTPSNSQFAVNPPSSQIVEIPKTDKKLYQVLEVVDGDTVKISEIGTLRLIGIDTPETRDPRKVVQCFGKEASENAKKLLNGQKVYLEFDKSKPILDKYQRTLAYIFREDGYFYNLEAVKNGFAHSYKSFPHPKLDEFNSAENGARNDKKGFWADNTCQGNTEQGVSGEVAKATVPPIGGTQEKAVEVPKAEIQIEKTTGGFIAGSCASLKKLGLGNFRPGDPNYNSKRDGNGDGVACEM